MFFTRLKETAYTRPHTIWFWKQNHNYSSSEFLLEGRCFGNAKTLLATCTLHELVPIYWLPLFESQIVRAGWNVSPLFSFEGEFPIPKTKKVMNPWTRLADFLFPSLNLGFRVSEKYQLHIPVWLCITKTTAVYPLNLPSCAVFV